MSVENNFFTVLKTVTDAAAAPIESAAQAYLATPNQPQAAAVQEVVTGISTFKSAVDTLQPASGWQAVASQLLNLAEGLTPLLNLVPGLPPGVGTAVQWALPFLTALVSSMHLTAMHMAIHEAHAAA